MFNGNGGLAKKTLAQMFSKSGDFWIKEGQKKTLKLFHDAAVRIPAYKDFLQKNRIDHVKIKTWQDFQTIPFVNKKNYLTQYPYKSLFWDGNINEGTVFSATSGSTGEPYYFPRSEAVDWQSSVIHEYFYKNGYLGSGKSTLVIVGFGMGVWIGGVITYQAFKTIANRGNNISVITAGINKKEIFGALKKLSSEFDQTILVGYPPFIKDVIDEAPLKGISIKNINLRLLFAAEPFTEGFRDYLVQKTDIKNKFIDTMNIYGSSDIGSMAHETPLSILVRTLAVKNQNLFKNLFNSILKTPTLCQFNPLFVNFEEIGGEVILSGDSALPLIRYSIGDNGGVFSYSQLVEKLKAENINIDEEIKKAGIKNTLSQQPFVYVYERRDLATTLYGLNIYPEYIREALLSEEVVDFVTGKSTMFTKFNNNQDQYLEINVELKEGVEYNKRLVDLLQKVIVRVLLARSSEFHELYKYLGDRAHPDVKIWTNGDPNYFDGKGKQKWVKQGE